ncbi:MAG: hypothetical protein ACRC33_19175 [Gemmataceae bacterium]
MTTRLAFLLTFGSLGAVTAAAPPPPSPPPSLGEPTLTFQSVTEGVVTTWKIRGDVPVKHLPAAADTLLMTLRFEMKPAGNAAWTEIMRCDQVAGARVGNSTQDTGFNAVSAPNKGDTYRVLVSGAYGVGMPLLKAKQFTAVMSRTMTPVP